MLYNMGEVENMPSEIRQWQKDTLYDSSHVRYLGQSDADTESRQGQGVGEWGVSGTA